MEGKREGLGAGVPAWRDPRGGSVVKSAKPASGNEMASMMTYLRDRDFISRRDCSHCAI